MPVAVAAGVERPRAGEVSFGSVRATAPAGATRAALFADGRWVSSSRVRGRSVRFRFAPRPARYRLSVRFYRRARIVGRAAVGDVWLLPRSAQRATRERTTDRRLGGALARLGRTFPGYAAFWVHDLATGRTAGWNSDALFPAASTVKLGVLMAALRRFGPHPERSIAWRDIRDLATWSSNIASNRLLLRLGGSEVRGAQMAQTALWRAGARSSTFTGNYRLGTAVGVRSGDTPKPLPLLTYRRTTAHDLGRTLFELHAAALGNRLSLRRTGTTLHTARLALGLLLSSDPGGENRGLFRPALGNAFPMAQKQGWTTSLRHTAAVVYGPRGPKIVVLLTYRPGITHALATSLGTHLLRVVAP